MRLRCRDAPQARQAAPWRQNQNYFADIKEMRKALIEDEALEFAKAKVGAKPELAQAAEKTASKRAWSRNGDTVWSPRLSIDASPI